MWSDHLEKCVVCRRVCVVLSSLQKEKVCTVFEGDESSDISFDRWHYMIKGDYMCFLTDIVITVILRVLSTFLTYFPRNQMVPLVSV
jgi:hypothetical protein